MKLVPMRFKGVQWHHNPKEIVFECDKSVKELNSPNGTSYIQNMGRKNMIISGTGELYGNDCLEQFDRLLSLFRQGGQGVLAIPKITPVYAVFESLKIKGEPKPDVLEYSFVFREVMEEKQQDKAQDYTAEEGECLWDISYKFGVPIDTLVRLNSGVKRPDIALGGRVIRLC
ncbi:MAG: LysM peptidoglycan-binding domain-containing protein [Ruminococcus sp.]